MRNSVLHNENWHSIDAGMVDVLNHLAEFAEFNELDFHIVLPNPNSDWWNRGGEYEVSVGVMVDTPETDAFFKRSDCRTSAGWSGIHLELPDALDTAKNRETLFYGAKAYLRWKTRMQVVTFGELSQGTMWKVGQDAAWLNSETIELYRHDFQVYATEAKIFEPEPSNEIHGIRGNELHFFR